MIILFLVIFFRWSPPLEFVSPFVDPWANFQQLVWPILSVGYRYAAVTTRMTRSTVLEVMREDYVRMVDAIAHRDIPVVQALVLLTAFVFVVINLIIDLLYAWLDPRISYR